MSSRWPFAGPKEVLGYLSRYTHRVAISNRRLIQADRQTVTFGYKDYAANAQHKIITLGIEEFVRRFCLHVLPERFVKIRHYGLLGNRQRHERLGQARKLLGVFPPPAPQTTLAQQPPNGELSPLRCPFCQRPALLLLGEIAPLRAARRVAVLDSS